jgi:hypothetical protein
MFLEYASKPKINQTANSVQCGSVAYVAILSGTHTSLALDGWNELATM